jgi:hypothetical protein
MTAGVGELAISKHELRVVGGRHWLTCFRYLSSGARRAVVAAPGAVAATRRRRADHEAF